MRRPRILKLTISSGHMLLLNRTVLITRTFAGYGFLEMIGQLNNGIRTPTFFAANAIVVDPLHRVLVPLNLGKKFAHFQLRGVPKSSTGCVQRILHAHALTAVAKPHSA